MDDIITVEDVDALIFEIVVGVVKAVSFVVARVETIILSEQTTPTDFLEAHSTSVRNWQVLRADSFPKHLPKQLYGSWTFLLV